MDLTFTYGTKLVNRPFRVARWDNGGKFPYMICAYLRSDSLRHWALIHTQYMFYKSFDPLLLQTNGCRLHHKDLHLLYLGQYCLCRCLWSHICSDSPADLSTYLGILASRRPNLGLKSQVRLHGWSGRSPCRIGDQYFSGHNRIRIACNARLESSASQAPKGGCCGNIWGRIAVSTSPLVSFCSRPLINRSITGPAFLA